ncbi:class II aldolase, partial [Achromobacter xylosoxidans]
AQTLGAARAVAMRGNGAVVAAESLMHAVVLTWYLEDAARIEWQLRSAGLADGAPTFSPEEAATRAVGTGRIYERMWEYLTAGDPEAALADLSQPRTQ